ncbi:hypothetical protein GCM10027020_03860 [Nocardioides salsibiostraticola]
MSATDVDALLSAPVVVLGSLPPEGRDLDLLVPVSLMTQVGATLREHGWSANGDAFVRFADNTAYAVDLFPLERWLPSDAARQQLLRDATTLPGYHHLLAPSPAHRLLLLAHRFDLGMIVDERRATRLAAYDADDWNRARDQATQWGLTGSLERLHRAAGEPIHVPSRLSARGRARRPARVISLSGLDGAGKSTQAEHLCRALMALGYDAEVAWTKLGRDPVLDRVSAPVKSTLTVLARLRGRPDAGADQPQPEPPDESGEVRNHPGGPRPAPDSGSRARARSPLLSWGWSCVVAVANARTHRRYARVRRGTVLICDRYALDSAAHLRYRYPAAGTFALQRRLIVRLSPAPRAAFFLDVSPSAARARKPEQYTTRDLARLRGLYLEESSRQAVTVVDGERPESELAAALAEQTWRALSRPGRLGRLRILLSR